LGRKGLRCNPTQEGHPPGFQFIHDDRPQFRFETAVRVLSTVEDGGLDPALPQGFGHFQGDVAGPDDDRPFRPLPVNKPTDADPVGQVLESEDIFRLLTGDPQFPGTGAGGDDQPVVGQGDFLSAGLIKYLNSAVGPVDGQGLMLQSDFNPLLGLKFLRSAGDQFRVVLDYITDVIGQLSRADGDKFTFFQQGNIGLGRFPPGAAGRRGSGC